MLIGSYLASAMLFFLPAGEQPANPWLKRVEPALREARRETTPAAYREALDVLYRADAWQEAADLAQEALARHGDSPQVVAPAARALWRAGRILEAETLAGKLPSDTQDPIALSLLIQIRLARGEIDAANKLASALLATAPLTGEHLFQIITARWSANELAGFEDLLRKLEKTVDPQQGYPEIHLPEQIDGLPEFFAAVGPAPLNQIERMGAARMPVIPLINLPGCEVMINGRGPYRMIVDTGGSIMLSLDQQVAEEIGLRSIASSAVHGVSGKMEADQALVDTLEIGDISCRRVVTRIFPVRDAIAHSADGILGTGILAEGRLKLDFFNGRLIVSPSSGEPAAGYDAILRLIGDAKLVALIDLQGEPATALLDSGADAFAISPARLAKLFPDRDIRTISVPMLGVGADRTPGLALTPGVGFTLGGREYVNYGGLGLDVLDTLLGPMLGVHIDLLVGMPILRQTRSITVDFPSSKLWIDWLEAPGEADR